MINMNWTDNDNTGQYDERLEQIQLHIIIERKYVQTVVIIKLMISLSLVMQTASNKHPVPSKIKLYVA